MRLLIVDALLALGIVVLTPLALRLQASTIPRGVPWRISTGLGGLAAVSLFVPVGAVAIGLALPWVGVAAWSGVGGLLVARRVDPRGERGRETLGLLAGRGYHVVGAVALVIDRAGADPLGTGAAIVTLTAVHFHFSGLMALTIVATTFRAATPRGRAGWLTAAMVAVAAAPVPIALGFLLAGWLQLAGAVVLTAGLLTWSLRAGAVEGGPLWLVARMSVWAGMAMAVWYAAGVGLGLPAPSIPLMAATHGILNGLGFAACGLGALHSSSG